RTHLINPGFLPKGGMVPLPSPLETLQHNGVQDNTPHTTIPTLSFPHQLEHLKTSKPGNVTNDRSPLVGKNFWNSDDNWTFRNCVSPAGLGTAPMAGGVAAYPVEWLEDYKELVFEITLDGGVFLINAHGTHRRFSPPASRQIWRRLVEILWWYPQLRGVNIQA